MKVSYGDLFKTAEKLKNHQEMKKESYFQQSKEKQVDNTEEYEEIKKHREL